MTTMLDTVIRREAHLLRFGTYLKSEYIEPSMQGLSKEIPKLLVGFNELNKAEQTKLAMDIRNLVSVNMGAMFDEITDELHVLTDDEIQFMTDMYDDYYAATFATIAAKSAVSTADNAVLALTSSGAKKVGTWAEFIADNIATSMKMVDGIVRSGFRDGATLQSIVSELRGSYNRTTKQYTGGVLTNTLTRYAETLARTGVSHYSNQARDKFAEKNSDILDSSVFFATLDNRTTTQCLGFHLSKWKNNDSRKPSLPLHYNERSIYLYAGDGIDPTEGARPIVGGKDTETAKADYEAERARLDKLSDSRAAKRADGEETPSTASKVKYRGRKDSDIFNVETVSAKVSSQQFMERQPRWFIESSLGKTRAKLFIDGDLSIDKFTDLGGRPLTLAELRETAAGEKAFRRAGID